MTVNTVGRTIDHVSNGSSTGPFDIPFRFLSNAELLVRAINPANGALTTLVLGADYSVTGADDDDGGALTLAQALPSGRILRIKGATTRYQPMNYTDGDNFPAESHERALDRQAMIVQEVAEESAEQLARALLVPVGETAPPLPSASSRAGKIFGWLTGTGSAIALSAAQLASMIVAEIAALLPANLKGDPGGNAMAIGLFTAAASLSIPAGTDLVQTSGYSAAGRGPARYSYDAAVDASYVAAHPRSAFVSANGRGFKLCELWRSIDMFGAVGDLVTDDYAAVRAACDDFGGAGGCLDVPDRRYRMSQTLKLTTGISLIGLFRGRNPGIVAGVNYAFPSWLLGSVLVFDAGVPGIVLTAHSDDLDPVTANGNWEFPGATWASIKDLSIVSLGGGTTATHGVESKTICTIENVYIRNFGGDGVRITASVNAGHPTAVYGNASQTKLKDVECVGNRGNGFYVTGFDANVVMFDTCNGSANALWGFSDDSLLGNVYINCHVTANTLGSYRCPGEVASSTYIGCYIEQGGGYIPDLGPACVWLGGNGAAPSSQDPDSPAFILGYGLSMGRPLKHLNRQGAVEVTGQLGVAGDLQAVFAWGSSDDVPDEQSFQLRYGGVTGTANWWGIQYAGAVQHIQFPNAAASARAPAPSFPNGLFLGPGGTGPRIFHGTAAPSSGAWNRGDIVYHSAPSAGGVPGWVCVSAGSPGTWKAMGVLAA